MNRRIDLVLLCFSWLQVTDLNGQDKLYGNEFPLSAIRITNGPFKHALDLNTQTLLKYDPDRFLAPYLKVASLPGASNNYENWESDGLDGHVGGHYLSALAIHFAATGNKELKNRLDYMLAVLKNCQAANTRNFPDWGLGYLGAVPKSDSLWPQIKPGNIAAIWDYWVPWYNVHKMYVGLRDAWLYANDTDARKMFLQFCDWALSIIADLSDAQMEEMLRQEYGGMNEVMADAFQMTGHRKYLLAARRFSHKALLNPLSRATDSLDNLHANTQVPKVIGFQRIAELSGDKDYENAGSFFWETVVQNRSLAFGGNSRREFFPATSAYTDFIKVPEGPESCNTYNMLKLTRGLFRQNPSAGYVDFFERALYNHILSTQHPGHGGYVYFTPARPRHYRVYSAPNEAMWCCVGTGLENHGKYGEFIYTHQGDSLFINLFVPSELSWAKAGLKLEQITEFPNEESTRFRISGQSLKPLTLLIRHPSWIADNELKIVVNGEDRKIKSASGSYVAIKRNWRDGDEILVELPMRTRLEKLKNVPDYYAFMHGPLLLAAKTPEKDIPYWVAGKGRWEHIAHGKMLPLNEAPVIVEPDINAVADKLIPIKERDLHFRLSGIHTLNANPEELILEPFYGIHDSRYMMYWSLLTPGRYKGILDSLALVEEQMLDLERRTVDRVQPGQQQPEADHFMESSNSNTGVHMDEFWRDARNGGYFSYELRTKGETNLNLLLRFWGTNWDNRKFDILIDDVKLATEDVRKWNIYDFREEVYSIPAEMLRGREKIRVRFQAPEKGIAGAIYFVRLFKPNE